MQRVVSVGSILMVARVGHYATNAGMVCGAMAVLQVVASKVLKIPPRKPRRKDFVVALMGMILSLSETIRITQGRFSLLLVLLASVASLTCFRWGALSQGRSINVILSVSALTCLCAFSVVFHLNYTKPEWEDSFSIWLLLASDFLVSNALEVWEIAACVGVVLLMGVPGVTELGPFLSFVFPCVCAWQRQRLLSFSKVLGKMKDETVLYCVVCVGALSLCCAVHEPLFRLLLCAHFGMRWI
jgi:hypothetical protein